MRPTARELRNGLLDARTRLESGVFDIFLSQAWARPERDARPDTFDSRGGDHAPETKAVLRALCAAGWRVWVDKEQLGRDFKADMEKGVAASAVFVALVSRKYARSWACREVELAEAVRLRKPIVGCVVEPDDAEKRRWLLDDGAKAKTPGEQEVAAVLKDTMLATLGNATAAAEWGDGSSGASLPAAQTERLNNPEGVPRLLQLVTAALRQK